MPITTTGAGLPTVALSSQEPFDLGSVNLDSVEPFDIEAAPVQVDSQELFSILGPVSLDSVEPFDLGETIGLSSIEPFVIASAQDAYLGVNSPASPKLGYWSE